MREGGREGGLSSAGKRRGNLGSRGKSGTTDANELKLPSTVHQMETCPRPGKDEAASVSLRCIPENKQIRGR
ncbi:hypothetical protein EYF80_023945 [Liparis tanakae]|uniref:Uncharacterized protein n=1 Tax=Liparis tanakae TaxID=230148 RepID=A0A4Z2HLB9_9TELE|nr:hypothetical protein EYF80_023945 [Liparis tanakae]